MRDIRDYANGVCLPRQQRQQREWACRARGGIGVYARAPANSQCEKKKDIKIKKIEFRSCSTLPACPYLHCMEKFQIFHEIKSRRSAPFVSPGYSYVRECVCAVFEDPLL